jgi:shikimate kinase
MIGSGRAFGAVSVVNALANGKGVTASIGLRTEAEVEVKQGDGPWEVVVNGRRSTSALAVATVGEVIKSLEEDPTKYHGRIETRSEIPIGVGLKSSSSCSVAVALATFGAMGRRKVDDRLVLRCSSEASLKAGVSITGALDDAASCLLGGINMTDNLRFRIISSRRLKLLKVMLRIPRVPSARSSIVVGRIRRFKPLADSLIKMCKNGSCWTAMTLNGLLYSTLLGYESAPAVTALEIGAIGAGLSGTGPAVAAIFEPADGQRIEVLRRQWSKDGSSVLLCQANNRRGAITD